MNKNRLCATFAGAALTTVLVVGIPLGARAGDNAPQDRNMPTMHPQMAPSVPVPHDGPIVREGAPGQPMVNPGSQ
jgi:hypothetical protein